MGDLRWKKWTRALLTGALMAGGLSGPSLADSVSFVAEATQTHPQGGVQKGKLYVSEQGMRFETRQGPRDVVQIVLPKQKITRVLFPADKVYMEMSGASALPADRPQSPCPDSADCKKLGDEKLGGTVAEKWSVTQKGAPGPVTVWWDAARKMSVRQEYFDGRIAQMSLKGEEDYEGRNVERWVTDFILPNGQMSKAVQLYDPKLGVAVKEVHPNGVTRHLSNVQEQAGQAAWFDVPAGYRKVDPPQRGRSGPAQRAQ